VWASSPYRAAERASTGARSQEFLDIWGDLLLDYQMDSVRNLCPPAEQNCSGAIVAVGICRIAEAIVDQPIGERTAAMFANPFALIHFSNPQGSANRFWLPGDPLCRPELLPVYSRAVWRYPHFPGMGRAALTFRSACADLPMKSGQVSVGAASRMGHSRSGFRLDISSLL
jgi:hypothetical protein